MDFVYKYPSLYFLAAALPVLLLAGIVISSSPPRDHAHLFSFPPRITPLMQTPSHCISQRIATLAPFGYSNDLASIALNSSWIGKPRRSLAVIIPVHPPKFSFALRILSRHAQQEAHSQQEVWDLVFVFSRGADVISFRDLLSPDLRDCFIAIVYPIIDKRGRSLGDATIITAKKYYGILVSFPCYEHLLVPDSEIDIFDKRGLVAAVRSAALRGKTFMGRLMPDNGLCTCSNRSFSDCDARVAHYVRDALMYLPLSLRFRAEEASESCNLYPWFSDAPIYVSADIPPFFTDVNFPSQFPGPDVFDHMAYQLWKLARGEWTRVDLSTLGCGIGFDSLPEFQLDPSKLSAWRLGSAPGPIWSPSAICEKEPFLCTVEKGTHIIYHLDRKRV